MSDVLNYGIIGVRLEKVATRKELSIALFTRFYRRTFSIEYFDENNKKEIL